MSRESNPGRLERKPLLFHSRHSNLPKIHRGSFLVFSLQDLTQDIVKQAMKMAEIPDRENPPSRVATLEKSLREAQDQLANEKKLRFKNYNRQARAKSNWKLQNSKLQKEVRRLNELLIRYKDEKQSAECDLNLYEHMLGERDRKIHQYELMLSEKDQKIDHFQKEHQLLLDDFIRVKVELEKLTYNNANSQ